jgi:hypothetical protein
LISQLWSDIVIYFLMTHHGVGRNLEVVEDICFVGEEVEVGKEVVVGKAAAH